MKSLRTTSACLSIAFAVLMFGASVGSAQPGCANLKGSPFPKVSGYIAVVGASVADYNYMYFLFYGSCPSDAPGNADPYDGFGQGFPPAIAGVFGPGGYSHLTNVTYVSIPDFFCGEVDTPNGTTSNTRLNQYPTYQCPMGYSLAHELGHIYGLNHSNCFFDLMNNSVSGAYPDYWECEAFDVQWCQGIEGFLGCIEP